MIPRALGDVNPEIRRKERAGVFFQRHRRKNWNFCGSLWKVGLWGVLPYGRKVKIRGKGLRSQS